MEDSMSTSTGGIENSLNNGGILSNIGATSSMGTSRTYYDCFKNDTPSSIMMKNATPRILESRGCSGLNGNWQTDGDTPHRREMIQYIARMMLLKNNNGSPAWLSKLPRMAKQLEVSLYRSASSFDEYVDKSTLKQRLQKIAIDVSRKTQRQGRNRASHFGLQDHQLRQSTFTSMRKDSTGA